jgi:predicted SnoaL-like aldol condensation-catalyzing enzyme
MGLPVWRKSSSRREWWTSFRLEDGSLVEHWDVIQDKAARETSKTGLFMFGDKFPD